MPRRIAIAALGLLAACGKAPPEDADQLLELYSLRRLLNELDVVLEGTLVEVDPQKLAAVLKVSRSLKGSSAHFRLDLDLKVGFLPYHDLIRRHVVENAPVVLMYTGNSGLLYLNRVFYHGYLDANRAYWSAASIERLMNRTYAGSVDSLAELIPKALSGEAVPPAPQAELPPIDTPSLRTLPLPGEPVDEEYLPAPFRRKAAAPPVLRPPETPGKLIDGLHLDYFDGVTSDRLNFESSTPDKTDVALRLDLSDHAKQNRYAVRFRGYVEVPRDGEFSFFVRTRGVAALQIGGSDLGIGDSQGRLREAAVDAALKAGLHEIRLTYLGFGGEESLQVFWSGPGFAKRPLPAAAFRR